MVNGGEDNMGMMPGAGTGAGAVDRYGRRRRGYEPVNYRWMAVEKGLSVTMVVGSYTCIERSRRTKKL